MTTPVEILREHVAIQRARIIELEAALKLIAECTPVPGPGFSLVLSMASVAKRALSGSTAQREVRRD